MPLSPAKQLAGFGQARQQQARWMVGTHHPETPVSAPQQERTCKRHPVQKPRSQRRMQGSLLRLQEALQEVPRLLFTLSAKSVIFLLNLTPAKLTWHLLGCTALGRVTDHKNHCKFCFIHCVLAIQICDLFAAKWRALTFSVSWQRII